MIKIILILASLATLAQCGDKGAGSEGSESLANVTGSIFNQSGPVTDMNEWNLVMMEKDSGTSYVTTINSQGLYEFKGLRLDRYYTIALLNPNFQLVAVLAVKDATTSKTVKQFFTVPGLTLPRLIVRGTQIDMFDPLGVTFHPDTGLDRNDNGIADGLEPNLVSSSETVPGTRAATDINGNGLLDWLDYDSNSNRIPDIFEADVNGDGIPDVQQSPRTHYFPNQVNFLVPQFIRTSDNRLQMRMILELSKAMPTPLSVSVLGPSDLFQNASVLRTGATGAEEASGLWDFTLVDSGTDHDEKKDDLIYARKIELNPDIIFEPNSVIFFRLTYQNYSLDFPYIIPSIMFGDLQITRQGSTVTRSGYAFGSSSNDFQWSVSIYDDRDRLLHSSTLLSGRTSSYELPSRFSSSTESYTGVVYGYSNEKVKGYPDAIFIGNKGSL